MVPVSVDHLSPGLERPESNNVPQSNESRPVCSHFNASPGRGDDHAGRRHLLREMVNVDQLFNPAPATTEPRGNQPELSNRPSSGASDSVTSPISPSERRASTGRSDPANNILSLDGQFPTASNSSMFYDSPSSTSAPSSGSTLEQQHQGGEVAAAAPYLNAMPYQEQLIQHFLCARPRAAIFAPLDVEWDFVKETVVLLARNFSPLMNVVCCYSGVHQSKQEGRSCQWIVPHYKAAIAVLQTYMTDDIGHNTLKKVFATVFFALMAEVSSLNVRIC